MGGVRLTRSAPVAHVPGELEVVQAGGGAVEAAPRWPQSEHRLVEPPAGFEACHGPGLIARRATPGAQTGMPKDRRRVPDVHRLRPANRRGLRLIVWPPDRALKEGTLRLLEALGRSGGVRRHVDGARRGGPDAVAWLVTTAELVGGALLVVGLLTRLVTLPLIATLIGAIILVKADAGMPEAGIDIALITA